MATASLLRLSAQEGARTIAIAYLDEAAAAAERLHDPEDTEALHDFRVGLRRLRSCLKAYEPLVRQSVSKKARRRIRNIARQTNPGRDAEVQLEWLEQTNPALPSRHKAGARWLTDRLASQKTSAYASVRETIYERFSALYPRLRGKLARYRRWYTIGQESQEATFAEASANALQTEIAALVADLSLVHSLEDEAIAHRARIHGKQLRYLMEPLRGHVEGVKGTIKRLKGLQDLLGDLNDLHNLTATVGSALEEAAVDRARRLRAAASSAVELDRVLRADERPGLLGILKTIQRDRAKLFEQLLGEWLPEGGRLESLVAELEATVATILRSSANPSAPPVEIERKYLLSGLPPVCRSRDGIEIAQGYVPGQTINERLRAKRGPNGQSKFVRTIKYGNGIKRVELEEECSEELFNRLWPLTEGCRLEKKRYFVEDEGSVWEIDEFRDRNLFLAEIELEDENGEVHVPSWLDRYVVREVTDEPEYLNLNLARRKDERS